MKLSKEGMKNEWNIISSSKIGNLGLNETEHTKAN